MSRAPFIVIDGRLYRWKDMLELRRAQLAAAGAAEASQLALFASLHDDRRPPAERTASGRYLEPSLFAALSGGDIPGVSCHSQASHHVAADAALHHVAADAALA